MSYDTYYYVKFKGNEVLLIERLDYEDSTVYADGSNDYTEHKIIEKIPKQQYEEKQQKSEKWKNAKAVDDDYEFVDSHKGEWDDYEFRTNGCGKTIKYIKRNF